MPPHLRETTMSDPTQDTTHTNGDVFPITLFARVVQGSEGTFIVTSAPPKLDEDAPGVAVCPIPVLDEGKDLSQRVGAALLRECGELYTDAALRTAPTFYGVTPSPMYAATFILDGDGNPVPVMASTQASPSNADATDIATDDAGEE